MASAIAGFAPDSQQQADAQRGNCADQRRGIGFFREQSC